MDENNFKFENEFEINNQMQNASQPLQQKKKSSPATIVLFSLACVALAYASIGFIGTTQLYINMIIDPSYGQGQGPGFGVVLVFVLVFGLMCESLPGSAVATVLSSVGLSIIVKRSSKVNRKFFKTFLILNIIILSLSAITFGLSIYYLIYFT